jgi:hypothetical protein
MSAWKAAAADDQGAIWAPGGPSVDTNGDVYVTTGNGSSTSAATFDYGDSVVRFTSASTFPPAPGPADYFAPADWLTLNEDDLDLGSSSPILLPDNLAFEDGKGSTGYLISTTNLGGIGHDLYEAPTGCASFGGGAYANGVIYVPCASGVEALALNTSSPSFSKMWTGPADAAGSPILAGGRVWVTSYSAGKLYGLDPLTGAVQVTESTPGMEHFTSPSASDGQLVLATGQTVEAWRIAATAPSAPPPPVLVRPRGGAPKVSGASLSGMAKDKPRLAFTVHQGSHAPELKAISVSLPAGLSFRRSGLARGVTVTGPGRKRARFTATVTRGSLTIALRGPESAVTVIVHGRAITEASKLARQAARKRRRLRIVLTVLDAGGTSTPLTMRLRD